MQDSVDRPTVSKVRIGIDIPMEDYLAASAQFGPFDREWDEHEKCWVVRVNEKESQ